MRFIRLVYSRLESNEEEEGCVLHGGVDELRATSGRQYRRDSWGLPTDRGVPRSEKNVPLPQYRHRALGIGLM